MAHCSNLQRKKTLFTKALNASPGAAVGEIVFDADKAEKEANRGRDVILVRDETSPEDIHGMHRSFSKEKEKHHWKTIFVFGKK